MIQRIQTLFLLAALALISSHLYSGLVQNGTETIRYSQNTSFFLLTLISSILLFITIFLYRHRMFQIRLSIFGIIVMAGYQIWLGYLFFSAPKGSVFSITVVFPVIAAILTFMAVRYIARDEALVRSVKSLRKSAKKRK